MIKLSITRLLCTAGFVGALAHAADRPVLAEVAWLEHSLMEPMPQVTAATQIVSEVEFFTDGVITKNRFHFWFDKHGRVESIASWYEGHFDQRVNIDYKNADWMRVQLADQAGQVRKTMDYRVSGDSVIKTNAQPSEAGRVMAEHQFRTTAQGREIQIQRHRHKLRFLVREMPQLSSLDYQEWDADHHRHLRYRLDPVKRRLQAVARPQADGQWRVVATYRYLPNDTQPWLVREKLDVVSGDVVERVTRRFAAK